ncbi:hypothetical protein QF032_007755 [Streptomyces achromogenes]|uniref:Uncharacterized protein n=1 Tax=Streptomyces achromogenes TaxID=67255 RepID=A0ABU0QDJ6_STRAH|nr:hypothetical protein [Streptomyces achromogenes]MDQ0688719.1 hypothetical protein [Streptomyces achromogenes]MDQ0835911.1 hypothetical protein [Streptomyces achromogenes]
MERSSRDSAPVGWALPDPAAHVISDSLTLAAFVTHYIGISTAAYQHG